jgi:nitrite reductase/ring-hydroxylating ferredoxin subunit
MMPYETYVNLLRQLDDLVTIFEHHPDPATQEQVAALLGGLDLLHREGLGRLVGALREAGADELLDRATADPIVKTLLGLYDLVDLDIPEETPFIPVEQLTVSRKPNAASPKAPQAAPAKPSAFVPLERLTVGRKPKATWVDVARTEDLPPGSMRAVEVDEIRVLLINVDGEIYAYRNVCPGSDVPLEWARLEGTELICPEDGSRYDARTGHPREGGKGRLEVFPVAVRGTSIQLARQNRPEGNAGGAKSGKEGA